MAKALARSGHAGALLRRIGGRAQTGVRQAGLARVRRWRGLGAPSALGRRLVGLRRCGAGLALVVFGLAEQSRERAITAAGDKRYRIWQVYLAGCAHGFQNEWMNVYQVLARREGETSNPLPPTRDYMYRAG